MKGVIGSLATTGDNEVFKLEVIQGFQRLDYGGRMYNEFKKDKEEYYRLKAKNIGVEGSELVKDKDQKVSAMVHYHQVNQDLSRFQNVLA